MPLLLAYNIRGIARVTGKTVAGDNYPNPNQTDVNYNVGGTDLGIMWASGAGIAVFSSAILSAATGVTQ